MSMKRAFLVGLISLGSGSGLVQAEELELTGFIGASNRSFWQDELLSGQDGGPDWSLQAQSELHWRSNDRNNRVSVVAFGRLDSQDSERTHVDLREAYWGYEGDGWDAIVGINKVFWGVTESRHLVDVINQVDLVEDLDQEDKLGQPMVNLNLQRDWGRLEFYVLPYFRERTFAGSEGRLRTPLPVDTNGTTYASPQAERHLDYAMRYSHFVGNVDIGIHYFDGTSRAPTFHLAEGSQLLLPHYSQSQQIGIDLQYTGDAWLWKLETLRQNHHDDNFTAVVAGFEYTLFQVRDSAADLGILAEYLYDDRGEDSPAIPFDDDLFLGVRLALNDPGDTSVLVGAVIDPSTDETFLNVEATRRLGSNFKAEFRLRAFSGAGANEAFYSVEKDDYAEFEITRYF